MVLIEIVNKLIGNIEPIGDSYEDEISLENLKILCNLTNELITQIDIVACNNVNSEQATRRIIGEYASNFLKDNFVIIE